MWGFKPGDGVAYESEYGTKKSGLNPWPKATALTGKVLFQSFSLKFLFCLGVQLWLRMGPSVEPF